MIDYYKISEHSKNDLHINGAGQKKLLLLYRSQNTSNEDLLGLNNIIKAINYSSEKDVYHAVLAKEGCDLGSLINTLEIKDVILFDISLKEAGLNFDVKKYLPAHLEKVRILYTDSINKILNDKTIKLIFWKKLQEMFLAKK